MTRSLLTDTLGRALTFLDELPQRKVATEVDLAALREAMGGPMPAGGTTAEGVIAELDARKLAEIVTERVVSDRDQVNLLRGV